MLSTVIDLLYRIINFWSNLSEKDKEKIIEIFVKGYEEFLRKYYKKYKREM